MTTTTTSTTTTSTTTSTTSTTSTTLPVTTIVDLSGETGDDCRRRGDCDEWWLEATVAATAGGQPVSGQTAVLRYRTLNWAWGDFYWSGWSTVSCSTDGSGSCTRRLPPLG